AAIADQLPCGSRCRIGLLSWPATYRLPSPSTARAVGLKFGEGPLPGVAITDQFPWASRTWIRPSPQFRIESATYRLPAASIASADGASTRPEAGLRGASMDQFPWASRTWIRLLPWS